MAKRKFIAAEPPRPKPPMGERGDSWGLASGGIIVSNDYNKELTGTGRIKIFDKMRLGDATVRAMLRIIKLPIKAANWRIDPASELRVDKKITEFISKELFENQTRTWDEILNNALLYLDYGSIPFEIIYEFKEVNGQIMIGLHKLATRRPDTIQAWKLKDGSTGISQYTVNGLFEIPIKKCIVFINEREGENWEGISLLRYAYKHWYIKDKLYMIDAMAQERQGLGVPYAKLPAGATSADKDKADELLENMRASHKGFIRFPEGWEVGFLDMKSNTSRDPKSMIDHHDRQITKSVLAQFLELGRNSGGSYALQKDQGAIFIMALEAIAKTIRDTFQKFLIKKLVDYNFDVEQYPQLKNDSIGQKDLNIFTTALQRAVQVGAIKPDSTIEQFLRQMMNLPESEGELADPEMAEGILKELEIEMNNLENLLKFSGKYGSKMPKVIIQWKKIAKLRRELRSFTDKVRRELLEMKARGVKLTEQEKAKRELVIFDQKKKFRDKIDTLRLEIEEIKNKEIAQSLASKKASQKPTPDILLRISKDISRVIKSVENAK